MIAVYNTRTRRLEIYEKIEDKEQGVEPLWQGLSITNGVCVGFTCIDRNRAVGLIDPTTYRGWRRTPDGKPVPPDESEDPNAWRRK